MWPVAPMTTTRVMRAVSSPDGLDDPGAQLRGADHGVDRADLDRALDAVYPVELGGHLADLLRSDGRPELVELRRQRGPVGAGGGRHARLQVPYSRVGRGAGLDV